MTARGQQWRGRPATAVALRAGIVAVPLAASLLTAWAVSRMLTPQPMLTAQLLWWAAVTAPATFVLWLVDRLARRLLPLAALMRLTMIFPDRAPSRLAVARTAGSTKQLRQRLEQARTRGVEHEPAAATTVLSLVAALSLHDRRTRGHAERVRIYTDLLAEQLGLSASDRDRLRWAALVHDMGKLTVPHKLLNKAGTPTEDEWQALRQHPVEGARLCAALLPWLADWGKGIIEHHERFDGSGYPAALAGAEISLAGRVLAVADSFEVMTAARAYKRAMSVREAREELIRCAGSDFDPAVVRAFLNISLPRLRLAMGPLSWLAQWPILQRAPQLGPSAGWITASIGGAAAIGVGGIVNVPHARAIPPRAVGQLTSESLAASDLAAADRSPGTVEAGDAHRGDEPQDEPQSVAASSDQGQSGSVAAPTQPAGALKPRSPADSAPAPAPASDSTSAAKPDSDPARDPDTAGGPGPTPTENGVLEPVLEPITDAADTVLKPITDAADPVLEPITDAADPVLEPITDAADTVVKPITDAADPVVNPIIGLLD